MSLHKLCDEVFGSFRQERTPDGSVMNACVVNSKDAFHKLLNDKTWDNGMVKLEEDIKDVSFRLECIRKNANDQYMRFYISQWQGEILRTLAIGAKVDNLEVGIVNVFVDE